MKKMLAILMGLLLMTESTGIAVQGYTGASAGTEPQDSVQGDSWSSSIPDLPDAGEYEEESVPDPVFIEEVSEDGSTYDNDDPSISWIESDAQIEGDIQIEGEEVETGEEIEEDEDEDLITAGDESDSPEDDVFFDDELIGDEELSGTGFYGDDADESGQEKAMNGIPLVVIRIDEKELHQSKKGNWYGTIADMNESSDHSVRCEGSAEIVLPESGYQSEYGGAVPPEGTIELDYIRGRGNSTWESQDKRPYKLQFKDKLDLFGMGESKEWALMANAMDPTLIKNRITSWLGDRMGFAWSPQMVPVDVVMIGSESGREYLGSYCLSELVDIEPSRLALDELGKNVTATVYVPMTLILHYQYGLQRGKTRVVLVLLLMVMDFAGCAASAMGALILPLETGILSAILLVRKRQFRIVPESVVMVLPAAALMLAYFRYFT